MEPRNDGFVSDEELLIEDLSLEREQLEERVEEIRALLWKLHRRREQEQDLDEAAPPIDPAPYVKNRPYLGPRTSVSIADAIRSTLVDAGGKRLKTDEIVTGVRARMVGGHRIKKASVASTLSRMKARGIVKKDVYGWFVFGHSPPRHYPPERGNVSGG